MPKGPAESAGQAARGKRDEDEDEGRAPAWGGRGTAPTNNIHQELLRDARENTRRQSIAQIEKCAAPGNGSVITSYVSHQHVLCFEGNLSFILLVTCSSSEGHLSGLLESPQKL